MKRAMVSGFVTCSVVFMMMVGCTSEAIDIPDSDRDTEEANVAAQAEQLPAGADLAEHGIVSYQIERADDATSIRLQAVEGKALGALRLYDPRGSMHIELTWDGHDDAFELDLREGQSPFIIITDDGAGSVTMGRRGQPEGDPASLQLYEKVKPRWDVVAKIFRDLQIDGRRQESVTKKVASGEQGAIADDESAIGYCSWCDNGHNCNFLGWSRKYEGWIEGTLCHSQFSWCGC